MLKQISFQETSQSRISFAFESHFVHFAAYFLSFPPFPSSFSHSHKYGFEFIFPFFFSQKREIERESAKRARHARKVVPKAIVKTIRFVLRLCVSIRNPNITISQIRFE